MLLCQEVDVVVCTTSHTAHSLQEAMLYREGMSTSTKSSRDGYQGILSTC